MKLFWRALKRYKGLATAAILLLLVDVAGSLFVPTIQSLIANDGVGAGNTEYILNMGVLMLVVSIVASAAAVYGNYLSAKLAANVGRDIRNSVYDSSLAFSNNDFEKFGTGSMITRTMSDVTVVQETIILAMQQLLPAPAVAILGTILTFSIDVHCGILMLVVVAVVLVVAALSIRYNAPLFRRMQSLIDRMNTVLRESIVGVRVVRAFNKEGREEERSGNVFSDYAELAIKVNFVYASVDSFSCCIMNIVEALFMWLGGNEVGAAAMEIGDISAIVQYAMITLSYIMLAQFSLFMMPRANACLERCEEVVDTIPEIQDGATGEVLAAPAKGGAAVGSDAGAAEAAETNEVAPDVVAAFDHMSFRYADAEELTLHDIDFCCRRGQTTAIIGSTGSGKSTVAKMLLRLLDASEGSVVFCGHDVRSMTQHELRDHIAYVPQRAWLFSGTIESNLRYGREDATEEELRHALDVAQAGFVYDLPQGLEAPVSQGGTNFSGGQRQRLSIARALVKPADLYIFDDSFSALDFKTDAALRRALEPEMRDAAALIIAQRVSTIAHADQIVVLKDGEVQGVGTHEELLETCPVYQGIAASQAKGGE